MSPFKTAATIEEQRAFRDVAGALSRTAYRTRALLLRLMNHLLVTVQACSATDDFDG